MLRRLSCKFLLATVVLFCLSAFFVPETGFAQGKSQTRKVLISFRQIPGPDEQALVRAAGGVVRYSYRLVPGIAASVPQAAIDGLSRNPNVTKIEDDLTIHAIDAELDNAWGVKRIGSGTVHDSGNKGTGIKVAVIDSGIYYTHPDLNANYSGGYDFANSDADPMDDHGHGTHVAGTIAGEDDSYGVVGVAPEADLYALKVLTASGSGSYSDVVAALEWAMSNGIQVTNNSYGSSGYPGSLVELTFALAADSGIINVCAAGNSGNPSGTGDNMIYPARFGSCIAVAATTSSDVRASFSSTGQDMWIAAPGASILSTYINNGYAYASGTSMACPHVSGVVALMINAGVGDIANTLASTADDLGDPGWDPQYGYGLVNAVAAVGGSTEPIDNPPSVTITSPPDGSIVSGSSVSIAANASDDNGVAQVEFFVNGGSIGVDTTAPYGASWDSTSVGDGSHIITATATDSIGQTASDTITVYVDNINDPPVANAGPDQSALVGEVVSFDGSGSYDPDGSIASYDWDFDDGNFGSGIAPTHTYSSAGTYIVILMVTDDDGATDTDQVIITVSEAATPVSMHVDSITVSTINVGKGQKRGSAAVIIVDDLGNPVSNALVIAHFQDDVSEPVVDSTDPSGMVEFLTSETVKGRFRLTLCVDDVDHSILGYNPGDNVETCDSNY